ncbi:MAG: hypothetical protein RSD57_15860 [Comamonas sp.]
MSIDVFSNNASALTAAAISAEGKQIVLQTGANTFAELSGGLIQRATITNALMPDAMEIIYITAKDGLDLTVARGREDTNSEDWPAGSKIEARVTAGMLGNMLRVDDGGILKTLGGAGGNGAGSFVVNGQVENNYRVVQLSGIQMLHRMGAALTRVSGGSYNQDMNMSVETVGGSMFVELGDDVAVWAPDQSYSGRAIVAPLTPTGYNYLFEHKDPSYDRTKSATDPGFDDSGDAIDAYASSEDMEQPVGQWLPLPTPLEFTLDLPPGIAGVALSEVGFICYSYGATTPPVVTITARDVGDVANAVPLTAITEAPGIHRIPVSLNGVLPRQIDFKLDTPATGRFYGRFYWRGMLICA